MPHSGTISVYSLFVMKHSQSLKTPHKLAVGEVLISNALPETGWLTGSCLTSTVFALACSEALK